MTDDLLVWLRVQLDEDERVAAFGATAWSVTGRRNVADDNGDTVAVAADRAEAEHIARRDPSRVLREVEAKREIVDDHAGPVGGPFVADYCEADGWCHDPDDHDLRERMPCKYLRLLALPYSDRPGYRQEWVP